MTRAALPGDGALETERLVLRRLVPDDAEALHRCTGDPEVMRYWYPGPDRDVAATVARIAGIDAHWREHGFGDFAVVERAAGDLVGFAGVHYVPGVADVNAGWALARSRWRRGYGSELCAAILGYGFAALGLPEVLAVIDPRNSASIDLAGRMGLRLRREFLWGGRSRLAFVIGCEQYEDSQVGLRPVEPSDLPLLDAWAGALDDLMSRTRPYADAAGRHDPGAGLWWYVVTRGGAEVGTVWIESVEDGAEAVLGIYLGDPAWYGRGTGAAAVRLAVDAFRREHPAIPVVLRVRRDNARAVACYRRAGFAVAGDSTKLLPSGESVAFHRMVLGGSGSGLTVRLAGPEERELVDAFLREQAYGGGTLASDQLVVAAQGRRIAGACRLAREHGVLVLRGMRVREDAQRQGIGRRLLTWLEGVDEPCYCVPHAYLEGFYARAGFARLPGRETPDFLLERLARYRERGLGVIVMRRPAPDGASAA